MDHTGGNPTGQISGEKAQTPKTSLGEWARKQQNDHVAQQVAEVRMQELVCNESPGFSPLRLQRKALDKDPTDRRIEFASLLRPGGVLRIGRCNDTARA